MTVDEAIATVRSRSMGRTRYAGQSPFIDEILVAEVERLRAVLCVLGLDDVAAGGKLVTGLEDRGA